MEDKVLVCPICGDKIHSLSNFFDHVNDHETTIEEDQALYEEARDLVIDLDKVLFKIYEFNRKNEKTPIKINLDSGTMQIIAEFQGKQKFCKKMHLYPWLKESKTKAYMNKDETLEDFFKENLVSSSSIDKEKKTRKDFMKMSYQDFIAALDSKATSTPEALELSIKDIAKDYGVTDEKDIDAFVERQTKNAIEQTFGKTGVISEFLSALDNFSDIIDKKEKKG